MNVHNHAMNQTFNLLVGGEAGQGLATIGSILAKSLVKSGYSIVVTQSYQSNKGVALAIAVCPTQAWPSWRCWYESPIRGNGSPESTRRRPPAHLPAVRRVCSSEPKTIEEPRSFLPT